MHATIGGIEYYLPENVVDTDLLSKLFPNWTVAKIDSKTGIGVRHIASADQYVSDLALSAVRQLFDSGACTASEIDFLLLCTQSPDYAVPTTACLLQDRLGLPTTAGCLDYNLGCSGFVYGLGLAEGLIASGQASRLLLVTAETYSKYTHPEDKTARAIFGDGAAATLIIGCDTVRPSFGPFIYGTDGSGAYDLIVQNSGARFDSTPIQTPHLQASSNRVLKMDGPKVFNFAVNRAPLLIRDLLHKASMTIAEIDLFVLHQANAYLLDEIRNKCEIPVDKFQVTLRHCANTVSSTIPIALKHAQLEGKLAKECTIMLIGFGVGYSWAATIVRWLP
jgi:3-oxoacyl-[acyl-carrier-protein] synthase III